MHRAGGGERAEGGGLLVVVLELIEHDRALSRRDEDDGLLGFRLRVPGGLG